MREHIGQSRIVPSATVPAALMMLLSEPQRRVVAGLQSFAGDNPTVEQLAAEIGRTRKAVERIVGQLVAAGLYVKQHRGRRGGGRAANELILADLADPAIAETVTRKLLSRTTCLSHPRTRVHPRTLVHKCTLCMDAHLGANGQAKLSQKGNGQAKSGQKANGQTPPVHLVGNTISDLLVREFADAISEAAGPVFQNYSGGGEKRSIVANDATHTVLSNTYVGQGGGHSQGASCPFAPSFTPTATWDLAHAAQQDLIQSILDAIQPCDDELQWLESQGDVVVEEDLRLLSIDPGSLCIGWALFAPGPAHVQSGAETVAGGKDVNLRAMSAGEIITHLIHVHQPSLVLLERPNFRKEGIKEASLETFHKAFREIERAMQRSHVSYECVDATALTRYSPNAVRENIKELNQQHYQRIVGRRTNEHTADAFRIGWEYLMRDLPHERWARRTHRQLRLASNCSGLL